MLVSHWSRTTEISWYNAIKVAVWTLVSSQVELQAPAKYSTDRVVSCSIMSQPPTAVKWRRFTQCIIRWLVKQWVSASSTRPYKYNQWPWLTPFVLVVNTPHLSPVKLYIKSRGYRVLRPVSRTIAFTSSLPAICLSYFFLTKFIAK